MRFVGALCALSMVLSSASAAMAASGESLAPAERAELDTVIKDALAHAKKGDYEAARVGYEKAYEKFPTSAVLFNLALAELRSGHALDALHHFDLYLVMDDADKGRAELVKSDLRPKAYAATGHVFVEGSAPTGARISVDGRELADGDARLVDVTPGEHDVIARTKDGTWRAHVSALAGQNTTVSFELVARVGAAPAPAPTQQATALTPAARADAAPVPPSAGADHAAGDSFWNARRVTAASILGGAVVAAGAGVVFLLESNAADSHASDLRTQTGTGGCAPPVQSANQGPCGDLKDSVQRQSDFQTVSTGLFVGAGVLAVSALVTYVLWPSNGETRRGAIVPIVDPVSKSGALVGRFAF